MQVQHHTNNYTNAAHQADKLLTGSQRSRSQTQRWIPLVLNALIMTQLSQFSYTGQSLFSKLVLAILSKHCSQLARKKNHQQGRNEKSIFKNAPQSLLLI